MARRALIIANDHYIDDAFEDLAAASADAKALRAVLEHPGIGSFTVESRVGVDRDSAMRAMESFFADAGHDDLLLLHLSVHGWKNLHNSLYFIMRDTDLKFPDSTAIPADTISKWMTHSPCQRIVVTLDCCYSGAFPIGRRRRAKKNPTVNVAEPLNGTGRVVITASTSLQFAHENNGTVGSSREAGQPAVFTSALVDGLKDGSADLDGDGKISIHELFDYVSQRVRAEFKGQTPTLSVDNIQGTIIIADAIDYQPEAPASTADSPDAEGRRAELRIGPVRLTRRQLSVVGLATVVGTGGGSGYAWWQNRGSDDPSGLSPQMAWSFFTDFPTKFPPVVAEGTVYVRGGDLFALDAATGKEQWTFTTDSLVETSPTVADGTVYVGGQDDRFKECLFAVDPATGEQQWAFPIGDMLACPPVVAEEAVYISTHDYNFTAVDAATGEQRWAYPIGDIAFASPVVADGTVYISGGMAGSLFAVDAATGTERWVFPVGDRVSASPVVTEGTVYVGSNDGNLDNLDGNLFAVDAVTGEQRWVFPLHNHVISSPAVADGTVYVGGLDDDDKDCLFAVDAATGEQRWAFPVRGLVAPVVAEGTVYVASNGLVAVDAATGMEQWTLASPTPLGFVSSSSVVAEGTVYAGGGWGGNLYAVDAASGMQLWAFPTRGEVFNSPTVAEGRVFVVCQSGGLYAVAL